MSKFKAVELSVQLLIEKVSCPGVWLCQDGCVSLLVFTLGSKRETSALPPVFPLEYKKVFHFSKVYRRSNSITNLCEAIKEESIYCELVQWSNACQYQECVLLAQYLGSLNDILFIPNTCSNNGVDLLMRRTAEFPGILAPKIEIMTKVRIDEIQVRDSADSSTKESESLYVNSRSFKTPAYMNDRQKPVCHTPQFHRPPESSTEESESMYVDSRNFKTAYMRDRQKPVCHTPQFHRERCHSRPHSHNRFRSPSRDSRSSTDRKYRSESVGRKPSMMDFLPPPEKLAFESRYISSPKCEATPRERKVNKYVDSGPCTCEICTRYHQQFCRDRRQF